MLKQHAVSEAKDEGEKYRKIKDPLFRKIRTKIYAVSNPLNLFIKEANVEDASEVVEAERAIAEEPGYFCSQSSELTVENVINTITAFKDGNGLYLGAESDGKIVGHAFLKPQHIRIIAPCCRFKHRRPTRVAKQAAIPAEHFTRAY